jgi:hypothetical protein
MSIPPALAKYFGTYFDSDLVNIADPTDVMRAAEEVDSSLSHFEQPDQLYEVMNAIARMLKHLDLETIFAFDRLSNAPWSSKDEYLQHLRAALQLILNGTKEKLADYEKAGAWVRPATP